LAEEIINGNLQGAGEQLDFLVTQRAIPQLDRCDIIGRDSSESGKLLVIELAKLSVMFYAGTDRIHITSNALVGWLSRHRGWVEWRTGKG
jgi:hypothetical protein